MTQDTGRGRASASPSTAQLRARDISEMDRFSQMGSGSYTILQALRALRTSPPER